PCAPQAADLNNQRSRPPRTPAPRPDLRRNGLTCGGAAERSGGAERCGGAKRRLGTPRETTSPAPRPAIWRASYRRVVRGGLGPFAYARSHDALPRLGAMTSEAGRRPLRARLAPSGTAKQPTPKRRSAPGNGANSHAAGNGTNDHATSKGKGRTNGHAAGGHPSDPELTVISPAA